MLTFGKQPKPLPPVPTGAPAPAPALALNETMNLLHFDEVRRLPKFDHEARPPHVTAKPERRSNMSSIARLFKMWPKSKDPPSKSHPKSIIMGDEEEGEKEDGVAGLQRPRGANTRTLRVAFATVETKRDSGAGINPSSTVAPRQFIPPTSPPTRVMSPGIAAEYVAATRTLGVPDVAPPQRAPTPIISRRRGRASSAQYPERSREPFEDA